MSRGWKKRVVIAGVSLAVCFTFTGCGDQAQIDRGSYTGEIHAYVREEESGTRAEFEQLVNTNEAGAKDVALATDEMLERMVEDKTAIGYAAYSASVLGTTTNDLSVSILSVDGIPASAETIKNKTYPLCRDYLLAYNGELSDLAADFLRYVKGAGQKIVQQSCVPVHEVTSFLSDQSAGTLCIRGSSSIAPMMEALVKDYQTYNQNAKITVTSTDSGDGLSAAIRGECDLAMSSRGLKDYEKELRSSESIGRDAIVLIVNGDNGIRSLTLKEIKNIYDGTIKDWSEL